MKLTGMILGAVLAAAGPPASDLPAAQAPATAAARSPRYQAAYALAQQLRTEQSVLQETGRLFEKSSLDQLAANPEIGALEKAHPGIWRHVTAAARPELERQVVAGLPLLWASLATIYAEELTDAEIEQARVFYTSPAGQRLRAALIRNYDVGKELAPLVKDENAKTSAGDIRNALAGAIPETMAAMSAEDRAALLAFSQTPAFAKIERIGPRVLEASAAWGNREDPAGQQRINAVMEKAATEFLAAEGKRGRR